MTRRHTRGFSLLEIIAALVLLALLAAVLLGIVGNSERAMTAASRAADRAEQMLRLKDFLREHVGGLMPLRWRRELGQPLKFDGGERAVTFLAPVVSHIAEGGLLWWRLEIDSGSAPGRSRLVMRRVAPDPEAKEPPGFARADSITLADDIAELRLRYFDPGTNPVDEPEAGRWVGRWDDADHAPTAIEIVLIEPGGRTALATVVPLRISQAVGCNFDFQRQRCLIPGVSR